ncbi:MAG: hypothetical protein ACT4OI_03770, partial [Methanobacteriota archaeon]
MVRPVAVPAPLSGGTFVLLVTFVLLWLPLVGFASVGVGPATAPDVDGCYFFPDPRLSDSFACGTDNSFVPAFVNTTVRFNVSVLDADPGPGEDMDVTFFFDYLKPDPLGGPPLV